MNKNWLLTSSAALYIPTLISLFTQHVLVFLILFFSSTVSLLYHLKDERDFLEEDVTASILLGIVMILALFIRFITVGPFHWLFWGPLLLLIPSLVFFFLVRKNTIEEDENYDLYHSLWHFLIAGVISLLVIKPVAFNKVSRGSFWGLSKNAYRKHVLNRKIKK